MALTLRLWSTSFIRGFPEPSGEDRNLQLGLGIIYGNRGKMTAQEFHMLGCEQPTWAHPLCPGAHMSNTTQSSGDTGGG